MPKTDDDKKPDFLKAGDDDGADALPQAPNNPEPEVQAAPEAPAPTPEVQAAAAEASPSPDAGEGGDTMPPWAEKLALMISEGSLAATCSVGSSSPVPPANTTASIIAAAAPSANVAATRQAMLTTRFFGWSSDAAGAISAMRAALRPRHSVSDTAGAPAP